MDKEKRKQQKAAWDRDNTTMVPIKLQKSTDADILAFLDGKQRQTIIKLALREYMENHKEEK